MEVSEIETRVQFFIQDLKTKKMRIEMLSGDMRKALDSVSELKCKHNALIELVASDIKAGGVIKLLFEKVSMEAFGFLESLCNQALEMVFDDENYTFKIELGTRGVERTVEFYISNSKGVFPLTETGGGVQVLISFVFRIYFILRFKLNRVIIMDETFSQLSPQYLDNLLAFMRILVAKFGFTILWISHSPYLEGRVDHFYELRHGKIINRVGE